MTQLHLGHVGPSPEPTIAEAFERFDRENPQVYETLRDLAFEWKRRRGDQKCGVKMLYEVARYRLSLQTEGDDFKLNNSYTSLFARKLMAQEPELRGLFETRRLHPPGQQDEVAA